LAPLDESASETAVAAWLPEADPFLMHEIVRQCGGSPLFIEELCQSVAAGGDVTAPPSAKGVAWIDALVASRLERLPGAVAEMLQLASVIGNVVAVDLLQRVAGPDAPALPQWLHEQDLLVGTAQADTLRFKHALSREAVYATVNPTQRRAWHLRVAQTLEAAAVEHDAVDSLEALSYHSGAAQRSEQTAHFAVAAGDKAFAASALDRARAHYLTALHALDALPLLAPAKQLQWCAIAQKLGTACVFDPLDLAECSRLFARAVELARASADIDAIARAEYWMGYASYSRGRPREAVRHCEAALEHALAGGEARLVAQLRATLGQALVSAGRYERALPLLREAVQSKRQQSHPTSSTAIGSAYSLARLAFGWGDLGRLCRTRLLRAGAGDAGGARASGARVAAGADRRGPSVAGPLGRSAQRRVGRRRDRAAVPQPLPHRDGPRVGQLRRLGDRRRRRRAAPVARQHSLDRRTRRRRVGLAQPRLAGRGRGDAGPRTRGRRLRGAAAGARPAARPPGPGDGLPRAPAVRVTRAGAARLGLAERCATQRDSPRNMRSTDGARRAGWTRRRCAQQLDVPRGPSRR
jgi:tetratricopeptide (TPR) repeat protein